MSGAEPDDPASGRAAGGDELSAGEYRRRALIGGVALALRTALAQLVVLGGTIVLARRLSPRDFGAFAIIQFALSFLTVFGDAGLGGALVQKKTAPTREELSSVFWVQLALGGAVLLVAAIAAEGLRLVWGDLPPSAPWILRALAVNFALVAARAVPMISMERELMFVRLAAIDLVGSLSFYLVACGMALAGFGMWSLVAGVLAQGALGTLLAFAMRPVFPSLVWDGAAVRRLLRFGVPHQLKFVVGFAGGATTPLLCGALLGAEAVGLIQWAQTTGFFPIRLVEIVSRVSFPLYARLQDDRPALTRQIDRSVAICAAGAFAFAAVIFALGPAFVSIVYSSKWLPALPMLYLFAGSITVGSFVPLVAPALDALGKPKIMLYQAIVTMLAAWAAAVPLALTHGAVGFVAGSVALMVAGNVVMAWVVRRELPALRIARPFVAPSLIAIGVAWAGRRWALPRVEGPLTLTAAIVGVIVVFAIALLAVDRELLGEARLIARKQAR
ncbi:MAG: oligosaccharide flippase family protein [Polyangiaceae bacterium]|nr:oligosaccharide flippase family protein [Polyangiaceae bacterium]